MKKIEKITKTDLKKRGWNDALIKQLLPAPELKTNPMYKCAAPMQLWSIEDVKKAERRKAFKEHLEKSKARKEGGLKAAEKRRQAYHDEVTKKIKEIEVEVIEFDELKKETIKSKQLHYDWVASMRGEYWSEKINVDELTEEVLHRWMVNYIRHELTTYDSVLYEGKGKVGRYEQYHRYKNAVLDAIAVAYPFLQNECEKQKTSKCN